jgi:hypothetical protein
MKLQYLPIQHQGLVDLWEVDKSSSYYRAFAARLDCVCADTAKCDICKIGNTLVFSIYHRFRIEDLLA